MSYKFTDQISLKDKKWEVKPTDENYCLAAKQKYGLSDIIGRLLFNKQVSLEDISDFLDPKIKNFLPDPYFLLDMEKATHRVYQALINNEKIVVYGDYDVDGATSSAILKRFFRELGKEVEIYIPDRISEGYGLNVEALIGLKNKGFDLVITVDCGITSFEPIAEAQAAGLDVIILDHHLSSEDLPNAIAAVNPNRIDQEKGLNNLCAAGVAYVMIIALNRYLREMNYYQENSLKAPDLLSYLDLVALGTVCDVMTLTGINRAFVSQGLRILASRKNKGISQLLDLVKLNKKPDVYTLGFLIGPRINAAGRIDDCSLGSKLLSSEDDSLIFEIANQLHALNHERQEIEKKMTEEVNKYIEDRLEEYQEKPFLMLAGEGWHQGVIGIVAGRLKEAYNKPTAVITIDEQGIGKASARSVKGVNIGSAITEARIEGLLVAGGGHSAAAGFTIEKEKLKDFESFVCDRISKDYAEYANDNSVKSDAVISVGSVNLDLLEELEKLEPYGQGNSAPRFIVESAKIVKAKIMGEKHLSFFIVGSSNSPSSKSVKCLCFNVMDKDFGKVIENSVGKEVSLLGTIKRNSWNGYESAEFFVDDVIIY